MKRFISCMLAIIIIFAITSCGKKNVVDKVTLPDESTAIPKDFDIRYSSKMVGENVYDTYTGTIKKDLISAGSATDSFTPSGETLKSIYDKILELEIDKIDKSMTADSLKTDPNKTYGVKPLTKYEIQFTIDGVNYSINGDATVEAFTDTNTEAKHFMEFVSFMQNIILNTAEYKALPEPVGGYR